MDNVKKDLVDSFCRISLIEFINKSKYKDNKKLKNYVLHEATNNDILSYLLFSKSYNQVIHEDATTDMKMDKAQEVMSFLFDLGPSFLLAEPINKSITDKIIKGTTQYEKLTGKQGQFIKGTGHLAKEVGWEAKSGKKWASRAGKFTRGIGGTIVTSILLSFGFSLLSKAIFSVLKRSISLCQSNCNKKVPKIPNRSLHLKICTTQCKIHDLQKVSSKLRGDISNCNKTENPEKCKAGLMKQVGRLNDMFIKERQSLQKHQLELRKKNNKTQPNTQPNTQQTGK